MVLRFDAQFVSCSNAGGGDILQISFDTMLKSDEEDKRRTPYVLISRNFEFAGSATIEWHDGHDYDGGAEITSLRLSRECISIRVDQGLDFEVTFRLPAVKFDRLTSFLRRMIDADRISLVD